MNKNIRQRLIFLYAYDFVSFGKLKKVCQKLTKSIIVCANVVISFVLIKIIFIIFYLVVVKYYKLCYNKKGKRSMINNLPIAFQDICQQNAYKY